MKLGITKFVVMAAIAVFVVVSGSTATWAQACPTSPSYPDFSSVPNQSCLTLTGINYATPIAVPPGPPGFYPIVTPAPGAGTVLRLTPNQFYWAGSAWFNIQQQVASGFTTSFTFELTGPTAGGGGNADGIAFVIQNSSLTALGPEGCGIGFGGSTSGCTPVSGPQTGIPSSLAVEFKTHSDSSPYLSPNSVFIQSNGPNANCVDANCGIASNTNLAINLGDGNPHTATITYTPPPSGSGAGTLDVTLDTVDLFGAVPFDITSIGLTGSGAAYVGFTGATGGGDDNQDILSWTFTPAEVPLTVTELGLGAGTVVDNASQINCSEANGLNTGTPCSATYAGGTVVTLTETAGTTAAGQSTFGGWGGACAGSGTNPTCSVTMSSAQNVSATFLPPPVTNPIISSTCSGTNVSGTVNYCPNNSNPISPSNPCTDPNGVQFSVSIPVVSQPTQGEACLALSVTATEVNGDGLCPAGGTGQSGDFDCRLVNFYGYGTDPATGSTVTPLCYPYSNGSCTFYTLTLTGGGVPNNELYSGGVYWQVAFNSVFAPPSGSYWAGSTPSLLDDPGEDEISPLPWGTNCTAAMQTDNPTMYPGPYYCQFDNDITTFYQPGGTSFDPVGGKTAQLNDVVVTFLPTSAGTGGTAPQTVPPVAIAVNCVGTPAGCTTSGTNITFAEGTGGTAAVTSIGAGSPPAPPYPTPTVTAVTTVAPIIASEGGNTVTLTTIGSFGSQAIPGNTVMVSNCTPAAYNGTFAIVSGSITMLSYTDSTSGLGAGTGCQALVLPNGLTFNASTGLVAGTAADGTAGNYPITFTSSNFNPGPPSTGGSVTQSYTLAVNPAGTLTITASSGSMTYGGTAPAITPSYMGFVNGDTPASLTSQPTCSTTAKSSSPVVGSPYPSTCTGAADANYSSIAYVPGTVTVTPAPLIITASSATMSYGGAVPTITPSYSGFVNGDTPASLTTQPTCTTTAKSTSPAGIYPSTCTGAVDPNYAISYKAGTVTVGALEITPSNVNFGTLYLGQLGVQGIILKNTGTTPITFSSFKITGGNAASEYGDISFCPPYFSSMPGTLPAGKSCLVGVGLLATLKIFSPTPSATTLVITDSAAGSPQTVQLTTLVINPVATLSSTYLSSGKLTFPITTVGKSNLQSITVTNTGNTPLTFGGTPASVSSGSGDFTLTSTTCTNATLNTGGTCVIGVTFTPKATGTFTGTLKVTDNAANSPQTITLSGTT